MRSVAQAADKEGEIKLIWGGTVLGGSRGAARIEAGMNKMFGTHIKVRFTPGQNMTALGFQIVQEAKAGHEAASDIYIAPLEFAAQFAKLHLFLPGLSEKLLPGRVTDQIVEENGTALRFVTMTTGITYNAKLLPKPPRTVAGFLDPALKGKLASTPYATKFDWLSSDDYYGEAKTIKFAEALTSQIAGLIRCGDDARIASGEFLALVFDCGGGDARLYAKKGAPVAHLILNDFSLIYFFYLTIPRNAAHPDAARILSAYLVTPEGQKIAWETWGTDLHLFPESNMRRIIDEAEKEGAKMKLATTAWYAGIPNAEATRRKIVSIFESRSK
jgi:ABC-type Fe3+ transport system substrate-binding protein